MNKFEYVVSGCNYSRLQFAECSGAELNAWIRNVFASIQNKWDHNVSLLTNAYVEKSLAKQVFDHEKFGAYRHYTDSGGLQIITQGLQNTKEIRQDIYKIQASYSDIAMSFDEIPLGTSETTSKRLDVKGRWFDPSLLESKARETGRNVHDQINFFLDEKVHTKPIIIIQGNSLDSYRKWCDYLLDEIPQDKWKYIGGVALGSAAYGTGDLEEITKAFIFKELPVYEITNHLHLLGIGAISRLIPYIIATQNGLYREDLLISYDSTSHSSSMFFGRYFGSDGKYWTFPTYLDQIAHRKIYEDVISNFDFSDIPLELFYDGMALPTLEFKEKYGSRDNCIKCSLGFILSSVINFIRIVDKMKDKNVLLSFVDSRMKQSMFSSLYGITNIEDFKQWNNDIGRTIKSNKIRSNAGPTLADLWE